MRNKYYSKKISVDGMIFDSKKEYKRWNELRMLEKSGGIRDLKRQVKFVLILLSVSLIQEVRRAV